MRLNALSSGRQANPQLISKKRGKHHGQRQNRLHADSAGTNGYSLPDAACGHTYACDRQNFRVIEEVAVGKVFFNWIFGFEGKVRIKAPENVKQQYEDMVHRAAEMIE